MDTDIGSKRKITETEINELLSMVNKKRLTDAANCITPDDITTMSYHVSNLVQAVEAIVNYPSKFQVDEFKGHCRDKNLLYALQDPQVVFGLDLKQYYDMNLLPVFDKLRTLSSRNPDEFKPDPTITAFMETAHYFLPSLPAILNDDYREQFEEKLTISNLLAYGRRFYDFIVAEIAQERFPDRELEDITMFTEDNRLPTHWNKLYKLQDEDDFKTIYHENFFAFIGALALSEQKDDVKEWLTVLLEALFISLDGTMHITEDAVDKLFKELPNGSFKTLHKTIMQNNKPFYLVQFTFNSLVLGTASGATQEDAQAKVASTILYNSLILEKARSFKLDPSYEDKKNILNDLKSRKSSQAPRAGSAVSDSPVLSAHDLADQNQQAAPMAQTHNSVYQSVQTIPTTSNPNPNIPVDETIYKFVDPPDDNVIDNASKERLNTFLIGKKLPPAEYKTSKVNNSEVQVTCFLGGKGIARASGTNKKKAGQWVAQNVLKFIVYFLAQAGLADQAGLQFDGDQ